MKAVRFHEYGGPEVLRYEDADRPNPAPGQVLVRVAATTFNPVDASIRAGYLRDQFDLPLPHVPGLDLAGTVERIGDHARGFDVGDPVVGFLPMALPGAAGEFVLASADILTAAPTSLPLADAAVLPAGALTAWQALFRHAQLRPGQRVLVNGAGGGVGGYVVQLAKHEGAYVIATASPRSEDAVRNQGADEVIDYTATPVTDAGIEPVDVVISLVMASDDDMAAVVRLVRPGGVIVTTASDAEDDTERGVRAVAMFVESDAAQLASIVELVDAGELSVDISARFRLPELAEVHRQGAAGAFRGKVLVTVDV